MTFKLLATITYISEGCCYLSTAGFSKPLPCLVYRDSPVLLSPPEQVLHHLIGTLLLRRTHNLLPTALGPASKESERE